MLYLLRKSDRQYTEDNCLISHASNLLECISFLPGCIQFTGVFVSCDCKLLRACGALGSGGRKESSAYA